LYKFEEEKSSARQSGVTFINLFPRRLSTKTKGLGATIDMASLKDHQIAALYQYWSRESLRFLQLHTAHVLVIAGRKVRSAYCAWTRVGLVDVEPIRFSAEGGKEMERVIGWKEYKKVRGIRTFHLYRSMIATQMIGRGSALSWTVFGMNRWTVSPVHWASWI